MFMIDKPLNVKMYLLIINQELSSLEDIINEATSNSKLLKG